MSKITKTIAGFVGVALALALSISSASNAKAYTTAELTQMIASLQAQLMAANGTSVSSSVTFTRNLTIGSTGADVTALQNWLIAKGYSIPAGATGYFGAQTRAALAAYQAANGISPAAGYFGPITRTAVNAAGATTTTTTTTTVGCAPGAMFNSMTGASCTTTTTTTTTGISTPGVEGTLTVTSSNTGLTSTVHEGETMLKILGAKVEAKNSDISIQRVKLNLGTNTRIFNKLYRKLYVMLDGNTLASVDLNNTTVVKDGSTYFITIAGFNGIVKKGESKQLTIAADVYGTIDSTDVTTLNSGSNSQVAFADNGVRGLDGAGIDQYGPATGFGRTVTVSTSLVDSATLKISTSVNNVKTTDVVAHDGTSNNELDKLTVFAFDVRAEKDAVTITDISVTVASSTTGTASSTTAYLYDGSTEIDSAPVGTGLKAVFSDVDYIVPKDTTKTLWVKVDVRRANGVAASLSASIASAADVVAENSAGDSVTPTGTASGETMFVRNVGPVFALVSKTVAKSTTASQNNVSTSTVNANFTLTIKAVGGDIYFGTQSASTTFNFAPYKGGVVYSNTGVSSSTSFDVPSSGVVTSGLASGQSFLLQQNNEITLPVNFIFEGRTAVGALLPTDNYAVGLEAIKWSTTGNDTQTSSFMQGKTDWRTSAVALP